MQCTLWNRASWPRFADVIIEGKIERRSSRRVYCTSNGRTWCFGCPRGPLLCNTALPICMSRPINVSKQESELKTCKPCIQHFRLFRQSLLSSMGADLTSRKMSEKLHSLCTSHKIIEFSFGRGSAAMLPSAGNGRVKFALDTLI